MTSWLPEHAQQQKQQSNIYLHDMQRKKNEKSFRIEMNSRFHKCEEAAIHISVENRFFRGLVWGVWGVCLLVWGFSSPQVCFSGCPLENIYVLCHVSSQVNTVENS